MENENANQTQKFFEKLNNLEAEIRKSQMDESQKMQNLNEKILRVEKILSD